MHFVVAEQGDNKAHIEQVMDKVRRKMTSSQVSIRHQEIIGLSQHPLNNILQASLFILAVLSVLALLLSSFQVVNTISALMAHQIRQIGILKSMGATDRNIFLMYITLVMSFSLLAMVAAFPWTTLGAQGLVRFMGEVLNVPITNFTISPFGYLPEFIAGVAMPLLVAWGPIKNSVRITVSEAINHTNRQAASFGTNRVDRLLNRIRGLPSSVLYTFRNVFRNKKRLLFTLIVLTIAGTIFMTVTGIRSSLLLTLDAVSAYRQQDIEIKFEQQERVQEIAHVAHQVTGIAHVETRLETTASMRYHNQAADGINISLFGLSADTLFLQPTIIEGRWLLPEDEQALVVNAEFLLEMPDTQIGDEIVLELNNRATSWRIVGIVLGQVVGGNQILAPIAYTNYTNLSAVVGGSGRANRLLVAVDSQASGEIILQQLREQFNRQGLKVRSTALQQEILETVRVPFNIILSVVFIMIILFVVAGGLGLMGLISLNVLERTREFGVIRAIGATRKVITRTVLLEGVFIGILSWFVALWLALPMSKIMSNIVGLLFLNVPLNYIFPLTGMLVWLVIVIPLSTLASLLPAWNATRLSISQILSYE
ncbi:MAG: FtsX-like permease family protein [Chloroflexota bacterium]